MQTDSGKRERSENTTSRQLDVHSPYNAKIINPPSDYTMTKYMYATSSFYPKRTLAEKKQNLHDNNSVQLDMHLLSHAKYAYTTTSKARKKFQCSLNSAHLNSTHLSTKKNLHLSQPATTSSKEGFSLTTSIHDLPVSYGC